MNWLLKMQETAFGQNTRQTMRPMNGLTFVAGGRESQPIPRVGYLARVHWHFSGTNTVTLGGGTAALDVLGPWNLLNRVRVIANSGQDIYSTSGYGNFLVDVIRGPRGFAPQDPGFFNPNTAARVYAAAAAAGPNTWEWGVTVPIALNEENEMGLILLQNEMAQTTFALEYNASQYSLTPTVAPLLVTGAATAVITGTFTPTIETFTVPADPNARPDITWLHQILEFTQPLPTTGENTINLLRDNLYVDLLHQVILNGALNGNDVDRVRLVMNQSDTPYDFNNRALLQLQRRRFGMDLPQGVFSYPFFDQGFSGFGDERDLVNGRATSELQSVLSIATGATLGTNPRVNTIQRQLIKMQSPPTRQA